jgi:hypothetical protein
MDNDFSRQTFEMRARMVAEELKDETAHEMVVMLLDSIARHEGLIQASVQNAEATATAITQGTGVVVGILSDSKNSLAAAAQARVEASKSDSAFESVGEVLVGNGIELSNKMAADAARMELEQAFKQVDFVITATNEMMRNITMKSELQRAASTMLLDVNKLDIEAKSNLVLQQIQIADGQASWNLEKYKDVGSFIGAMSGVPHISQKPSMLQQVLGALTSVAGLGLSVAGLFI